jgi:hypothetical protein
MLRGRNDSGYALAGEGGTPLQEHRVNQLASRFALLAAIVGLVVFYGAIYMPHGSALVNGDRHRLAAGGIGLLVSGVGLALRQALAE